MHAGHAQAEPARLTGLGCADLVFSAGSPIKSGMTEKGPGDQPDTMGLTEHSAFVLQLLIVWTNGGSGRRIEDVDDHCDERLSGL